MNNEINCRDFMKLSVASIMTASVTLNLGNTAFATTASENPKDVLKNFFESFSPTDHESWVNYFASSVYGYYREFAQNAFNQAKRLGLLDIDKAELLYAEKVNNVYRLLPLCLSGHTGKCFFRSCWFRQRGQNGELSGRTLSNAFRKLAESDC